jgi:hypothetical protein
VDQARPGCVRQLVLVERRGAPALLRRLRRTSPDEQQRLGRVLGALAGLELTILYLAVADIVAKPTGADTGTLIVGAAALAFAVAPTIAAGVRAHPTVGGTA